MQSEGGRTLRGPLAESGPQPHLWHYCLLAYWWSIWTAGGNGHLTAIPPVEERAFAELVPSTPDQP